MNSPFQAERLFSRCFTEEQLACLHAETEFVEAARRIDSLKTALDVVDLGGEILRGSWPERPSWPGQKGARVELNGKIKASDSSTGL